MPPPARASPAPSPVYGPRILNSQNRRDEVEAREPDAVEPDVAEAEVCEPEPVDEQGPVEVGMDIAVEPECPDVEVDDPMLGALCANTDAELDMHFEVDLAADEWESSQLEGIDPVLITSAKQAELAQIASRCTLSVVEKAEPPR